MNRSESYYYHDLMPGDLLYHKLVLRFIVSIKFEYEYNVRRYQITYVDFHKNGNAIMVHLNRSYLASKTAVFLPFILLRRDEKI